MRKLMIILGILTALLLSACALGHKKIETNHYVLDYQASTERQELFLEESFDKVVLVLNASVNRTYNRAQIVEKESNYKVNFMKNELWANRLADAVPNIVTSRLRAYNIFKSVTRNISDTDPDYYLEINILNIERLKGANARAFLSMEYTLRDHNGDKVVLSHRGERYQDLIDESYVFLVQSFNNMIMEECNLFAAKCIAFLEGRPLKDEIKAPQGFVEAYRRFLLEEISHALVHPEFGELMLSTRFPFEDAIYYKVEDLNRTDGETSEFTGEFNEALQLPPGNYKVITGHNSDIIQNVEIFPKQRTALERVWSELRVRIADDSQNRVRQFYRLYQENEHDAGYSYIGQDRSIGEDEHGIEDKIWILPPGRYMLTLGGRNWSDLRDFTTVCLREGDSQELTVVVSSELKAENIMIGAGVLSEDFGLSSKTHKGVMHLDVNLTSNNKMDEKDPTYSLNLAGKFENTIDLDLRPFHYNMRSSYDISSIFSKDIDLRFDRDIYNLKNTLLLYPWSQERRYLGRFAFYGRADLNTHFMNEYSYFSQNKNIILKDVDGTVVDRIMDTDKFLSKVALYPLKLKEGAGITYRFPLFTNADLSLRGGYGWQQDYNKLSYTNPTPHKADDGLEYDIYHQIPDQRSDGLESILIFSAGNILNFVSINSLMEVFFPISSEGVKPRFDNENTISFRIFRNISMDVELNLSYDEAKSKWLIYDLSSFLRFSLFY